MSLGNKGLRQPPGGLEQVRRSAQPHQKARQSISALCIGTALLFLFASVYVHQRYRSSPTALSRLDLLHALAHGSVRIDAYHENTPDKAGYDGHFYSDKAPGPVFLALPGFAAAAGALHLLGISLDSDAGWLVSSWIACASSLGPATALGAALLLSWLARRVEPRFAFLTTLAIFFGAAPFPYATMLFSHSLVVGLIAVALWSLDRAGTRNSTGEQLGLAVRRPHGQMRAWLRAHRWDLLAGLACGLALASEYTSGIVVAGLYFWAASTAGRRLLALGLGAVPALLLIPAYSFACFGNPFILPYSLNASFPEMKQGLYAIKWPDPETAYNLLLSPARGLLFWSPFLALALVGYFELARTHRRLFWLTWAVPMLQVLVISGRVWDWPAGPTLGPRYLAPILPLLALPCALGASRLPMLALFLGVYSILATTIATLTNACPAFTGHPNPLLDLQIPLLLDGNLAPNLGLALGLAPYASAALFYVILGGAAAWLWRSLPQDEARPIIGGAGS